MESLLKQTRLKFSGLGEASREHMERERRIPPQKSQSFKEKKRSQNWLEKQFMRQTSQDFSSIDIEQATAVAAATYAVSSLEDSGTTNRQKAREDPQTPLRRTKSRNEDGTISGPGPGRQSERFTGEPSFTDSKETKPAKFEELKRGKSPSLKKTPSLADRLSESQADSKAEDRESKPDQYASEPKQPSKSALPRQPSMNFEGEMPKQPSKSALPRRPTMTFKVELPKQPSMKPESKVPKYEQPTKPQTPLSDRQGQRPKTKADAWQEEELARITERYEKLNATILEWESEKKEKARNKLHKKQQSEIERKRAKALEEFNSQIKRINQIAGGARSQAEERRIKEELKAKEKANKMRTTGKVPKSCFCC